MKSTILLRFTATLFAAFAFVAFCGFMSWTVSWLFFIPLLPGAFISHLYDKWRSLHQPWTDIRSGKDPLIPLVIDVVLYWFSFIFFATIGDRILELIGFPAIPRKLKLAGWILLLVAFLWMVGSMIWLSFLMHRNFSGLGDCFGDRSHLALLG